MPPSDGPEQLTPPPWRERLVPRTVLGMAMLILAFAIGAASSGVAFYSYYEFKKDDTAKTVETFVQGFDERFKTAIDTIEAEQENARSEIQKELEPLKEIRAEGQTLEDILKKVSEAVWFVRTLDEAGQPSVGSAFALASDSDETLLVTSYAVVRAATFSPGPPVVVRRGDEEQRVTVWTWQADRDLALLVMGKGNVPKLDFAPRDPPLKTGERVFAVSGLGGAGGAITQGFVADVSANGIQSDAAVGAHFRGGPLVNSEGRVLGVSSIAYSPLGFRAEGVYFSPPVRMVCDRILRCPSGEPNAAGGRTAPQPAPPPAP
ncbi:MAG TPA: serine protease [Acidimicrobiales bacterium]|nr:serine protease [Acidimicrobiales bacterium]